MILFIERVLNFVNEILVLCEIVELIMENDELLVFNFEWMFLIFWRKNFLILLVSVEVLVLFVNDRVLDLESKDLVVLNNFCWLVLLLWIKLL